MSDIKNLIEKQKLMLEDYNQLLLTLENNKEINDLSQLKSELETLNERIIIMEDKNAQLIKENNKLKNNLREHIMNEKLDIINNSRSKINTYFKNAENKNMNKLDDLENQAIKRTINLNKITEANIEEDRKKILGSINELENSINLKLIEQKNIVRNNTINLAAKVKGEYEELKEDFISEEIIQKRIKQNNIENKIGLNVVNKIGIALLIFGIISLFKYTYSSWLNDYVKSIAGFVLGSIFLLSGEWLNKKNKNVFSIGTCSLGIATLYISLFNSFFILKTVEINVALILSLLVNLISIVLSRKYKSRTITIISIIGGYLPLFSYVVFTVTGIYDNQIYYAMIYLLLLNIVVLLPSLENRWTLTQYVSLILNIPTSIYLALEAEDEIIALMYLAAVFVMYFLIVLTKPIKEKLKLKLSEVILLGINTLFNCIATYYIFNMMAWEDYYGILALFYALSYFIIGNIIKIRSDRKSADLFYLSATTFAILMIPFQFGLEWASLGWLIESVLLLHLTKYKYNDDKVFNNIGWGAFMLSVISFIIFEIDGYGISYIVKYTSIAISLIYILMLNKDILSNVISKSSKKMFMSFYKYFSLMFVWIYAVRMIDYIFTYPLNNKADDIFYSLFISIVTMLLATLYSRFIPKGRLMKYMLTLMYLFAIIMCINVNTYYIGNYKTNIYLAAIVILLYNMLAFVCMKQILITISNSRWSNSRWINLETYPFVLSIYLLGSISLLVNNQFKLNSVGLLANLIYIIMAFIYILYGFRKRQVLMRRLGLGLTLFSLFKLFIFEFSYVNAFGRIIAYFTFGVILMAISYMYQRLEKQIKEN
ncbi:MAG TPA: DUF2339 domain-containing protein [Clostridiales bacterium]|nr:DUF2339 domain-containing protein [Clostridiales bacterium]